MKLHTDSRHTWWETDTGYTTTNCYYKAQFPLVLGTYRNSSDITYTTQARSKLCIINLLTGEREGTRDDTPGSL